MIPDEKEIIAANTEVKIKTIFKNLTIDLIEILSSCTMWLPNPKSEKPEKKPTTVIIIAIIPKSSALNIRPMMAYWIKRKETFPIAAIVVHAIPFDADSDKEGIFIFN